MVDIKEIENKVMKYMDHKRFRHTQGVMYTAANLAMAHGISMEDAMLGGLLHDCAKCVPRDHMIPLCEKYNVELSSFEVENLALVHAKLGVAFAREKYDIDNPDILNAISYHTTGRPNMSTLEKIVYIADCIEPNRSIPGLEILRKYAFSNLDKAVALCSKNSLEDLQNRNLKADPMTLKTYEFYKI